MDLYPEPQSIITEIFNVINTQTSGFENPYERIKYEAQQADLLFNSCVEQVLPQMYSIYWPIYVSYPKETLNLGDFKLIGTFDAKHTHNQAILNMSRIALKYGLFCVRLGAQWYVWLPMKINEIGKVLLRMRYSPANLK